MILDLEDQIYIKLAALVCLLGGITAQYISEPAVVYFHLNVVPLGSTGFDIKRLLQDDFASQIRW